MHIKLSTHEQTYGGREAGVLLQDLGWLLLNDEGTANQKEKSNLKKKKVDYPITTRRRNSLGYT